MKRGRKSAAEIATISALVAPGTRLPSPPPAELSDAQSSVWRDLIAALPDGWLERGSFPVMIELCRRVCRARLLEQRVRKFELEWVKVEGGLQRLDKLLAMADRETRAVIALSRALRLTPHAIMHPRTAGRHLQDELPSGAPRPWDFE